MQSQERSFRPDVSVRPYADIFTWKKVYADWRHDDLAERGDPLARDTLLRIVQRDPNPANRARANGLLAVLEQRTL